MKGLARTMICSYVLWKMFVVAGEQQFVRLTDGVPGADCLSKVAEKAPYAHRVGLMRGYQEVTLETRTLYPSGLWYICYPEDYDPRDKTGSSVQVTP